MRCHTSAGRRGSVFCGPPQKTFNQVIAGVAHSGPVPFGIRMPFSVVAWYFDGQVTVRNTALRHGLRPEVPAPSWWPSFLPSVNRVTYSRVIHRLEINREPSSFSSMKLFRKSRVFSRCARTRLTRPGSDRVMFFWKPDRRAELFFSPLAT